MIETWSFSKSIQIFKYSIMLKIGKFGVRTINTVNIVKPTGVNMVKPTKLPEENDTTLQNRT